MTERNSFIGASEAAAALGLSRYKTPLQLWGEKTGNLPVEDVSGKLAVKLGNALEETVCKIFCEETGKEVRKAVETRFHPNYPFIGATLDRLVVGEKVPLEAKAISAWRKKEYNDGQSPIEYQIQLMVQIIVTGAPYGYLATLIGNEEFKWIKIERDDIVFKQLVEKLVHFWGFVERKEMPGIITRYDSDVLYNLFPLAEEGSQIDLGDAATRMIESRNSMIVDLKNLEGLIDKTENEIKAMLKESESAIAGKFKITWKNQSQVRIDTKALKEAMPDVYKKFGKESAFRKLTIKEIQNGLDK